MTPAKIITFQIAGKPDRVRLTAPAKLTTAPLIEVGLNDVSTGVEPVLIYAQGRCYLGVGADHSSHLGPLAATGARQEDAKSIGQTVIELPTPLAPFEWTGIVVESYLDDELYQAGSLAGLQSPNCLIAQLASSTHPQPEVVRYCGAIPPLQAEHRSGDRWEIYLQLESGLTISHRYELRRRR